MDTWRVKSWMTGDPVWLGEDASALEALEKLHERGIRHLPVLDARRRVVGVVSRDDLRAALPFPLEPGAELAPERRRMALEIPIAEVMTQPADTVSEEAALDEAADRMADGRLGCLPVVDAEGRLVAMLSETDLLRALARRHRGGEAP